MIFFPLDLSEFYLNFFHKHIGSLSLILHDFFFQCRVKFVRVFRRVNEQTDGHKPVSIHLFSYDIYHSIIHDHKLFYNNKRNASVLRTY